MPERFEQKFRRINDKYAEFSKLIKIKESSPELKEKQKEFLEKLDILIKFECLYFIVKIQSNIPISSNRGGLEMLYKPGIFDMERYLKSLRPAFSRYHEIQASHYIKKLAEGGFKEQLSDDQPIKCLLTSFQSVRSDWDNKTYKVKRLLYPFAFNQEGQVYEYLNLLMLCDEANDYDTYKIEKGNDLNLNSEIINEVNEALAFRYPHKDYIKKYNSILNSTLPEKEKKIAIEKIEVITDKNESTSKRPTLNKYEKEINDKITEIFDVPDFPHFEDAIHFLRNHNLLPRQ